MRWSARPSPSRFRLSIIELTPARISRNYFQMRGLGFPANHENSDLSIKPFYAFCFDFATLCAERPTGLGEVIIVELETGYGGSAMHDDGRSAIRR